MNIPANEPSKPVKPLTPAEQAALIENELILKKADRNDQEVSLDRAKAFARISEGRLFRIHGSMKSYGLTWGIEPTKTCRLTQAGKVFFNLQHLWDEDDVVAPTSAWQLFPLARLKSVEDQRAGWLAAVASSEGTVPSQTKVEATVAQLYPKKAKNDPTREYDSQKDPAAQMICALDDVTKLIRELSPRLKATDRLAVAKKLRSLEKLSGRHASKMELSKFPSRRLRLPKMRALTKVVIDPEMQEDLTNLMVAGFLGS